MESSSLSSIWDRTGPKHSALDHGFVSRLPNATILNFALTGFPSGSYFTHDIVIIGSAGLVMCLMS
eukprot:11162675-Ditylum_brightwellii.AAC.1